MGFDERSEREAILEMPPTFDLEGGELAPLYQMSEPGKLTLQERPDTSGWTFEAQLAIRMPTATDYFYPDFVAELKDGRQLVIEYKGEAYKTNDDSKEKSNIGLKAQELSGGKLLFLMAVLKDEQGRNVKAQILHKIRGD